MMPKVIELTIEMEVQKVSCPGVWLCQDGRVSLTVFALGTSYQTCLLPPSFPLNFRDVFYFRKRFQESCALNNICCLLKDETIYCELVQWCADCTSGECVILAQYLGSLNDVLFPPNMCSTDGVDLLMRRTKDFPGILSPKIEIATKVRIDEVWNQNCNTKNLAKVRACNCSPRSEVESARQKQVCHSAQYHRYKCNKTSKPTRSRSRTRSEDSRSCCSLERCPDVHSTCRCPNPLFPVAQAQKNTQSRGRPRPRQYTVCPVEVNAWPGLNNSFETYSDRERVTESEEMKSSNELINEERLQKLLLESRYVDHGYENNNSCNMKHKTYSKVKPCVCEICRKYHEIFHSNDKGS